MLEKFFGKRELNEEQKERLIWKVIRAELDDIGVNMPGMTNAFRAAQRINEERKFGFTNNFLLNTLRTAALSDPDRAIDEMAYGGEGPSRSELIEREIETLRKEVQSRSEKGSDDNES